MKPFEEYMADYERFSAKAEGVSGEMKSFVVAQERAQVLATLALAAVTAARASLESEKGGML